MSFESSTGETERRANHGSNDESSETARSQGDSIWGMNHMKDKVKDFVEGVKTNAPREAMRNISEAAGRAKEYVDEAAGQAKDYVESTTVRGMAGDVARLIKRYPIQSMVLGMALGFLFSRRRGD
jgi:hypothetical protein